MRVSPFLLIGAFVACNTPEATRPAAPVTPPAPSASPATGAPDLPGATSSTTTLPDAAPPGAVASATMTSADAAAPADAMFELERTPCLGTCPVYTVSIRGDGSWRFAGWYPHKGCAEGKVAPAVVSSLADTARRVGFFGMKKEYTVPITDMPSTNTRVTLDGKTKRVHRYGFDQSPVEKELVRLEDAIDAAISAPALSRGPLGACKGKSPYHDVP